MTAQQLDLHIFPNPNRETLHINYQLANTALVRINVYNLLGQSVFTLNETTQNTGYQSITWNHKLAAGTYFLRMEIDGKVVTEKLVVE